MFLELVDLLRCPNAHEETWLVAATGTMRNRHMVDGELGCPICRARYPVRNGTVAFGTWSSTATAAADEEQVVRMAALLNLDDRSGTILLAPAHASLARPLHEASGVQVLQLDPSAGAAMGNGVSGLGGAATVPLAAGSLRGAALDARANDAAFLESAIRAMRPAARVVAPVTTPLHAELKELARDDREWVAEKVGQSAPMIPLRRA